MLLPLLLLLLLCCYGTLLLFVATAVLLPPGAVRHRVPDGNICCWFIESDPSVFFLFILRSNTIH